MTELIEMPFKGLTWMGQGTMYYMVSISPRDRDNVWPLKSIVSQSLLCCMQQNISNGIRVTAAVDCIAPNWPVSHYLFPVKK